MNLETEPGMMLGTVGYMAPEQVRGRAVDQRADIFSFGVILYEMLSGRRAFQGSTTADTIIAVIREDPPDLPVEERYISPALERIVNRCLEKSPAARFQTATDLAFALEALSSASHPSHEEKAATLAPAPAPSSVSRERLAWVVASILGAALVATGALAVRHLREVGEPTARATAVQFTLTAPENSSYAALDGVSGLGFAFSPDGRQLAFISYARGVRTLWTRSLAAPAPRQIPGTEQAQRPFWSPDGKFVAFFADNKLKKVPADGGSPITICGLSGGSFGGTWNRHDVILFAGGPAYLQKVSAAGGVPTPATALEPGDASHDFPFFLPDDDHFIYHAVRGSASENRVMSLTADRPTTLGLSDSLAVYSAGHLLFVRSGNLMAQPFDARSLVIKGEPVSVASDFVVTSAGLAAFSASTDGVLGYLRGPLLPTSRLTWLDRSGKPGAPINEPAVQFNLSLSPDERRVAVSMFSGSPPNRDIWLIDLVRGNTATRLTFDPAIEADPIWSPDGQQVLFNSNRNGGIYSFFRHAANGSGNDEPVLKSDVILSAPDWSRDGYLAYDRGDRVTGRDLYVLPLSGDRTPVAFLRTPFNEENPAFSPDGHWIAYDSDASGRFEVYVRPFGKTAAVGGQFQISRNGGYAPRWRGDGKELFFLAVDGTMMSAEIDSTSDFHASVPRALFPTGQVKSTSRHTYAVTADGRRFLVPVPDQKQIDAPITVILNWTASIPH
jgi:Tol biopolymer transport system component